MPVAQRAERLAEGLLVADPAEPSILDATCTAAFFNGTATDGCGFDADDDVDDLLGVDGRGVNVTVHDPETNASDPVIDDADVEPGTHVTAMGQYNPEKNELPPKLVARATYVPDIRERATQDAGSFLAALDAGLVDEGHVAADLGEVVAGEHPGRTSDEEVTVFDSGGTGIETVAAAHMLYERAAEAGRGTTIDFAPASEALTGR
ncbi:MAG: DUF7287 family protein [Halorubrum sp.]